MTAPSLTPPALRNQPPYGERLELDVLVDGELNGSTVLLRGRGVLDEPNGRSDATFRVEQLPGDIHPAGLGAFLFTGYPNACNCGIAGSNPFAYGNYHYRRVYTYAKSSRETILHMRCTRQTGPARLVAHFTLGGHTPDLRAAASVAPIYEEWTRTGRRLRGSFAVQWFDRDGQSLAEAATESAYHSVNPLTGADPVYRYIALTTHGARAGRFRVVQDSHLVSSPLG